MRSTCRVVKKMLTNGRLMELPRATVGFAMARKFFSAGGDGSEFKDVLLITLLETLRRAANVPTITVGHKLVNKITALMGRQHVFFGRWQELSGCGNNTWIDGKIAALDCQADCFSKNLYL